MYGRWKFLLFSCSVLSNSLQPHGLQHASPVLYFFQSLLKHMCIELMMWSNHLILFTLVSSCPPSFPASASFPMHWLFASGGQTIRASASASVLPMNIRGWFPSGLTGLISLQSKGLSTIFPNTTVQKHWFFHAQPSSQSNSHIHTRLNIYYFYCYIYEYKFSFFSTLVSNSLPTKTTIHWKLQEVR